MDVSIGVTLPYYNRQRYIAEAIESVLRQKGVKVKIFAVNDGSTDLSSQIVKKYKKVINTDLKLNSGVAVARNLAASMAIAAGYKYIFNMGSDDILPEGALYDMADQLIQSQAAFCTPKMQTLGTDQTYFPPEGRPYVRQFQRNALVGATMYRSKVWAEFGGYDVYTYLPFGKATWEDYDLSTRVIAKGYNYCVSKRIAYLYRKHPESATEDIKAREVKKLLREAYRQKFLGWI